MWKVKRSDLNDVLDVIAMVQEKLGLPSSEYIWVRGSGSKIKMSVASYTAGEVELEGEGVWPFKDHFFLDRRTFIPWVGAARESKEKHRFEFHRQDRQLLVKHGSRTVIFSNQKKIQGYGNLSSVLRKAKNSVPVSKELKAMLSCGSNCAVADTIQPHLNCVYTIGQGASVVSYAASDYVFYIGKGETGGKLSETFPFPLFLIDLLGTEGLKKIIYAQNYVVLKFRHGVIWQSISQEAMEDFPIKRIKKYSKLSQTLPEAFTASSRRFSTLILKLGSYVQSERKRDWIVVIKGERGDSEIHLRSELPGIQFHEKLDVANKVKNSFRIEWPLGALIKVFDFLSKNTRKKPLTLRTDKHHKHSYLNAGGYWLCIPSKEK